MAPAIIKLEEIGLNCLWRPVRYFWRSTTTRCDSKLPEINGPARRIDVQVVLVDPCRTNCPHMQIFLQLRIIVCGDVLSTKQL